MLHFCIYFLYVHIERKCVIRSQLWVGEKCPAVLPVISHVCTDRIRIEANRITPVSSRLEYATKNYNYESNFWGPKQQKKCLIHPFLALKLNIGFVFGSNRIWGDSIWFNSSKFLPIRFNSTKFLPIWFDSIRD